MIDDSVINTLVLRDVCEHLGLTNDDVEAEHVRVGQVLMPYNYMTYTTYTVIADSHTDKVTMVQTTSNMFATKSVTLLNQVVR